MTQEQKERRKTRKTQQSWSSFVYCNIFSNKRILKQTTRRRWRDLKFNEGKDTRMGNINLWRKKKTN